jgi:23S rRNA (guanosine2251-2'-O)-methyltransferase
MQSCGLRIIACSEHSKESIFDCDFKRPSCIILGSEDAGINKKLLSIAEEKVRIPVKGNVSSLNVSVAAGIIMNEVTRQRGH